MKLDEIIKNTPNYKLKKHFSSLEIRMHLVEALEKAVVDGAIPVSNLRNVPCENGFISIDSLNKYLNYIALQREEKETPLFQKEKGNPTATVVYDRDFKISDNLNKGIAVWLERIDKELIKERRGRQFFYKGYEGITKDFKRALTEGSLAAIERFTFDFIKGALDFETIAKIRNEIKQAENNVNMDKPEYAFICFENPYYEFSKDKDIEELLYKEREDILTFAKAIVRRKVLKFKYQPVNHENEDTIILHPHYIRRVGRKYMIYGWGHKEGQEINARILNIILSRVDDINETDGGYKSASECEVDYNYDFFKNVIVYDAARDGVDRENPTRVVLKVVRERKAAISGKTLRPLARLMAEPLHHSMKAVLKNDTIDEKYGYVEMYVSDYMYLKRILLPWGADITVESPAELRRLMRDEAARMMEAYGQETEEAKYSVADRTEEEKTEETVTLEGLA